MSGKIYIAGPMRGHVYYNFPAFHRAEELLKHLGWVPISPASMDCLFEGWEKLPPLHFEASVEDAKRFMRRDLNTLLDMDPRTDAVYMLNGWEDSKGATVEKALAEFLGLKILYQKWEENDE